jgi:hypothetical protein
MVEIDLFGANPAAVSLKAIVSESIATQILLQKWYLGKSGYAYAIINQNRTPLHIYAWFLYKNKTPPYFTDTGLPGVIDHINRNKLDNTEINLRCVTTLENNWNRTLKNEMSCIKIQKNKLYHVHLIRHGQKISIKDIDTLENAIAIRNSYML